MGLGFRFKVKAVEAEFTATKRPSFMIFFLFAILLFIGALIINLVDLSVSAKTIGVSSGCAFFIAIMIFIAQYQWSRASEILAIIGCLIIYLICFYCRNELVQSKPDLAMGYFFGFLERLIVERVSSFWQKNMITLIAFIGRLVMLDLFNLNYFLFDFAFPLVIFLADFLKEFKERKVFRSHYDSKESLRRLKDLFKQHSSENLLVLEANLMKALYANDSFHRSFNLEPNFPIEGFLKQLKLIKSDLQRARTRLSGTGIELDAQEEGEVKEGGSPGADEDHSIVTERRDDTKHYNANIYNLLKALQSIKAPLEDNSFSYSFTFSSRSEGMSQKIYKVKVIPFVWDGTNAFVFILDDITHEYTIHTLQEVDENKDKVLETVTHELRTPLNAIFGMIQIMEKESTQPNLDKYLKTCKSSASLLLSLVNSILDHAQIVNNKFKLNISECNLSDILTDIISLFEFQCEHKNLFLKLDLSNDVSPLITTDKNRLMQIIINLVGNALKFTFRGGITIVVENDQETFGGLKISVCDTGIGIKDKDKGNLFKRFGKLEASAQINTQGIGLGLNISNSLAKLLNDNQEGSGLKVESEYGRGSIFSFTIRQELFLLPNQIQLVPVDRISRSKKSVSQHLKHNFEDEVKDAEGIGSLEVNYNNNNINQSQLYEFSNLEISTKVMKYHTSIQSSRRTLKNINQTPRPRLISLDEKNGSPPFQSPSSSISCLMGQNSPFQTERKSIANSPTSGGHVLIVDDNAFNLMIAREIFLGHGLKVDTALNGQLAVDSAISRQRTGSPLRMILMDCEMPVMNGYEAAKVLTKKMKKGEIEKVPIIGLTASTIESVKEKCLQVGMVDCLAKPLLEEDVQKLIAMHVQKLNKYL